MIFADAGAFMATHAAGDRWHEVAKAKWQQITDARELVATSTLVVHEVLSFFTQRMRPFDAAGVEAVGRWILEAPGGQITILRPSAEQELEALALFSELAHEKKKRKLLKRPHDVASYSDCVSFVLMREHGIATAFSFDQDDFRDLAGFHLF